MIKDLDLDSFLKFLGYGFLCISFTSLFMAVDPAMFLVWFAFAAIDLLTGYYLKIRKDNGREEE